jgi:hypothetical protein
MISCRFMRLGVSLALSLALTGCGLFNQVNVEPLATAAQRPSNVAAYVAVTEGDEPIDDLLPANFRVYENEQLVPAEQSEVTLLDRNVAAAHQALLLVDMSQAKTPEARALAAKAALNFVTALSPHEATAVYAFDGSEGLVSIANVAKGGQPPNLAGLEAFTPRDGSRNLNGAVVAAIGKLDAALAQSGKPVKVGMLVVFASGPDVAGRVDADQVHDKVWESSHDVIMVGVGEQADSLASLARRGLVRAQDATTLPIAFEEAAMKARAELEKYYLVSYCSPGRAGQRRLRLEVTYETKEGQQRTGDFELDFDARGFEAGCNSLQAPRLTLKPKETYSNGASKGGSNGGASSGSGAGSKSKPAPDSREHDQGEDAPVPPPDQSGYAK